MLITRALAVAVGIFFAPSFASAIPIANAGFEADALVNGAFVGAATGWTISDGCCAGTFNPTASDFTAEAPEGQNIGVVGNGSTGHAVISQALGVNAVQGVEYTLTALVGDRMGVAFPNDWEIRLMIDGMGKASASVTPTDDTFETVTVVYTALAGDAGKELSIAIETSSDGQVGVDSVKLVPEPSSALLATMGLMALGFLGRRRA